MSIDILTEFTPDLLISLEGFRQPERPVGMVLPENSSEHFIRRDRNFELNQLLGAFDKLTDGTFRTMVKLSDQRERVVELVTYKTEEDDTVRSIIIPHKKASLPRETRLEHAISIIESPEFGIFGEFHLFETRIDRKSYQTQPRALKAPEFHIFSMLVDAKPLKIPLFSLLTA